MQHEHALGTASDVAIVRAADTARPGREDCRETPAKGPSPAAACCVLRAARHPLYARTGSKESGSCLQRGVGRGARRQSARHLPHAGSLRDASPPSRTATPPASPRTWFQPRTPPRLKQGLPHPTHLVVAGDGNADAGHHGQSRHAGDEERRPPLRLGRGGRLRKRAVPGDCHLRQPTTFVSAAAVSAWPERARASPRGTRPRLRHAARARAPGARAGLPQRASPHRRGRAARAAGGAGRPSWCRSRGRASCRAHTAGRRAGAPRRPAGLPRASRSRRACAACCAPRRPCAPPHGCKSPCLSRR